MESEISFGNQPRAKKNWMKQLETLGRSLLRESKLKLNHSDSEIFLQVRKPPALEPWSAQIVSFSTTGSGSGRKALGLETRRCSKRYCKLFLVSRMLHPQNMGKKTQNVSNPGFLDRWPTERNLL